MLANLENPAVATGLEKSVFNPFPKKRQWQRSSNSRTLAHISHASKVMLKILQMRLQQYVNRELADVQTGFRKCRKKQRSKYQHPLDHRKSKRVPEKHLLLLYWLHQSLYVGYNKLENSSRNGNTRPPYLLLRNLCAGQVATVRTRHTTGCKLGKDYIKDICYHHAYLTSM